jgi:signal transduction histidine kinase
VDDNSAARLIKTRLLRAAGLTVVEAESGEQALEMVQTSLPSLVLLDVRLPDIDGIHVCQRIKKDARTRHVLVLQTSAVLLSSADRVQSLETGADSYITEPIAGPELVANVRALLRLSRAERSLREADRRKLEFIAILGHELRNPLAPIRNAIELTDPRYAASQDAIHAAWQTVGRHVDHLSRLVDDLRDVSSLAHGKLRLDFESIDVAANVATAIEINQPQLDTRRQSVTVKPLPRVSVWGDRVRMVQMLSNLVSNASRYSPHGTCINIHAEEGEGAVSIHVLDKGIGIATEDTARIFEPFVQSPRTEEAYSGGLGIGLALVRALAELHGGAVTAHSKGPGTGAEFTLTLPVFNGSVLRTGLPGASGVENVSRRSILVVDDDPDNAASLSMLLRTLGHEVHSVHTGRAALAFNSRNRFDVAIIDLGMPQPDGFEVARTIRASPFNAASLLIALTGHGQDEDFRASRMAGFDHHLVKPVDLKTLTELLAKVP